MELGFIQTAAAPSLLPLADASTPADSFAPAGGMFDAALAATLKAVEANAGGTTAPAKPAQVGPQEWRLTSLFMSSATTAAMTDSLEGEAAMVADDSPAAVEAPAESTTTAEESAAAADLVVPVPVVADTPAPVMTPDVIVASSHASSVSNGQADAGTASPVSAGAQGVPAQSQQNQWIVGLQQEQPFASALPASPAADVATPAVTTNAADEKPGAPETSPATPGGLDAMRSQANRYVQATGPEFVDLTAQPAAPHGGVPPASPAAIAAAIEPVGLAAASRELQQTESGAAEAGLRFEPASDALSGDAPSMAGDEQSGGQPRQSPEFVRFTAAWAQVAAATDGPGAAAAVASPIGAAQVPAPAATSSTAATASVDTPETPGAENLGRLVQAMRVIARPGAWEATVRLNPEHLGDVSIALRVESNSVSAVVNAEAAGVRQWLESQEQAMRSGMAEHGLQLERFIVQRDGQRREAESQQQQDSPRRQPRQRQALDQRFEIVV